MEPAAIPRRSVAQLLEAARSRMERLEPAAASRAISDGALLIDTRCADALAADGVVPGSIHVPLSVLYWRLDATSGHADARLTDTERQVILICAHGYSSSLAAATLRELGFSRATDVVGGFEAWAAAGLPITHESRGPWPSGDVGGGAGPVRRAHIARSDASAYAASRMDTMEHWQHTYTTRDPMRVGWYEADPQVSRRLVASAVADGARSVIDIGGGASHLVDHLLEMDIERMAVLDISEAALAIARGRLGPAADRVEWIVGDLTALETVGVFDVWHDRAVLHFLLDPSARRRYVALSERTVREGGTAVMAAFAPDGPERCSGLPVMRFSEEALARECGDSWFPSGSERHLHVTPGGVEQRYLYVTFRRVAAP